MKRQKAKAPAPRFPARSEIVEGREEIIPAATPSAPKRPAAKPPGKPVNLIKRVEKR
jgi:hypothetical protein